jgi:hypothetical protein
MIILVRRLLLELLCRVRRVSDHAYVCWVFYGFCFVFCWGFFGGGSTLSVLTIFRQNCGIVLTVYYLLFQLQPIIGDN